MNSGIYKIINTTNNKMYIGSAINLLNRKNKHLKMLRKSVHDNKHLQAAYNKYGEKSFVFDVIEYCSKEKLIEREQYYIDYYLETKVKLYNKALVAGSVLGLTHSKETKEVMSKRMKGKNNPNFGKITSLETRNKIANSLFGHKTSEETRKKLSETRQGNQNRLGKPHSEKIKQQISNSLKGRPSPNKGNHLSEELKNKLSMINKGKHMSEEAKLKMSEAKKLYWSKRKLQKDSQ